MRLAVDTSAIIDYIRPDRDYPPQFDTAEEIVVPLTVIGELYYGASRSTRPDHQRKIVEYVIHRWQVLLPDVETARVYGDIRAASFGGNASLTASKVNDLWIAALCIQHGLPLLTNDAGYDSVAGLKVLHW